MAKIVQIIDSYDKSLIFRVCKVVGIFNNPLVGTTKKLIAGSNRFLSWEFDEWLSEYKEFTDIESSPLRYGRVLVESDDYYIVKHRIWLK